MEGMLVVTLIIGSVGLILWIGVTQARNARKNFTALAGRLGLELEAAEPALGIFWPPPRARGAVAGRAAELYTFTRGSGKSRTQWCGLRLQPRAAGKVEFDLSPQGFSSRVMGWFGVKEITVGHQPFDDAFFVRTNQPELLGAALVEGIQTKLLAAHQAGVRGTFKLEQGVLTYVEQGSFSSEKLCARFESAAAALRDLADVAETLANG